MTHPLYSCKYVRLNFILFHNLVKNSRIALGAQNNFSESSDSGSIDKTNKQRNGNANSKEEEEQEKKEYPEEPTTCCMSGCANCVWLDYAEKLSEYYRDGGEQAMKDVNEKVTDQNLKAFLLLELRMRSKK